MMKLLLTSLFVLFVASNTYAQADDWSWGELDAAKLKGGAVKYIPPEQLKKFPIPSVLFVNAREEDRDLWKSVEAKIIYPFLCESEVAVLKISVDLCPERLGKKLGCVANMGSPLMIRVDISFADGSGGSTEIERNKSGDFDKDAYLNLLPEGFIPKRKCVSESNKN